MECVVMRFDLSEKRVLQARDYVAGGVNSGFRVGARPHPLVFESAHGPHLVDVDGNTFVDYVLGMGPMMLGHSPATVIEAARNQLGRSLLVAGQTETEYEAAELLVAMVPSADTVRFATSGTEAVQAALRVARAATGRTKVIKFEGHYHGWLDNVLWSVAPDPGLAGPRETPVAVKGSEGQLPTSAVVVLPWNDERMLRDRLGAGDIAAVIMEPIMFNQAGILPLPGYLEAARRLCGDTGTLLIFDEVITGFRVAAGGAQEKLGVTPDLTVLGKALANGFPVAALAGRRRYMDFIGDQRVLQGGTYNAQSVSMAATVATLREIGTGHPHERIDLLGRRLMDGLAAAFAESGCAASIIGYPAVFNVRFGQPDARDYREFLAADREGYADFAFAMLHHGVRILPRGTWFLSSAHDEKHVDETLAAARAVLREL
jgi:glutamate-1-semialdehyde 2,1-aminomutase